MTMANVDEGITNVCGGGGGVPEAAVRRSVLCSCFRRESGFIRREDVFIFNLL